MGRPLPIELPLEALEELCRKYRVSELSVFGSALRADFRQQSDIDLLVEFEADAEIGLEFVRLQRELSRLVGRPVDLIPKDCLKPLIRDEVLSQAKVLYAAGAALPG